VYDEDEPEVLTLMKQRVSEVEQNENHIWHRYLGEITARAFQPLF
jgi:1H-pyrrole-2-carbonyl-[peptidyl-carrier protein] chlorinase